MKGAFGAPLRLKNRFSRTACNLLNIGQAMFRAEIALPKVGSVPRHVGVIPRQPGQRAAIRSETRRRIEIVASGKYSRFGRSVARHRDQFVDSLPSLLMTL